MVSWKFAVLKLLVTEGGTGVPDCSYSYFRAPHALPDKGDSRLVKYGNSPCFPDISHPILGKVGSLSLLFSFPYFQRGMEQQLFPQLLQKLNLV